MRSSPLRSRVLLPLGVLAAAGVLFWHQAPARTADAPAPDPAALERTRSTVQMLDAIHKGYVVNITATYVKAQEHVPAAHVAKKVFKSLEGKGWGSGRLIDASGKPVNDANVARTPFEKAAVAKL